MNNIRISHQSTESKGKYFCALLLRNTHIGKRNWVFISETKALKIGYSSKHLSLGKAK